MANQEEMVNKDKVAKEDNIKTMDKENKDLIIDLNKLKEKAIKTSNILNLTHHYKKKLN